MILPLSCQCFVPIITRHGSPLWTYCTWLFQCYVPRDGIMQWLRILLQTALSKNSMKNTELGKLNSSIISHDAEDQIRTDVGFYKGSMVAIRHIDCDYMVLTKDNLMELKAVRNILQSLKQYAEDICTNNSIKKNWTNLSHATKHGDIVLL